MTAMNETSTITLPECHNLLALLLLNLNTLLVSSSSTTQEEEMIKKEKKRQCSHRTRCKTAEQSKSSSTRSRQRDRPHKQDTPSKKKRQVSHQKKKDRQNQSTTNERANTNHTHERGITYDKKKEKRKTTRHIPASPASITPRPSRYDPIQSPTPLTQSLLHYPHSLSTSLLSPLPTPYSHTAHTLNYTLLTTPCPHTACRHCTHHPVLPPIVTVPPPVSTLLLATAPMLVSVSLPLALNTVVPLPDGRYATTPPGYPLLTRIATSPLLSAYLSALLCSCLLSSCRHLVITTSTYLTFCVSPRSPALPPVPYASPLSLPAGSTTLTAR